MGVRRGKSSGSEKRDARGQLSHRCGSVWRARNGWQCKRLVFGFVAHRWAAYRWRYSANESAARGLYRRTAHSRRRLDFRARDDAFGDSLCRSANPTPWHAGISLGPIVYWFVVGRADKPMALFVEWYHVQPPISLGSKLSSPLSFFTTVKARDLGIV